MALITCCISGIRFSTSFLEGVTIPRDIGYYHPVFSLPQKNLYSLYALHSKGKLPKEDSYLLFLAFLHSSQMIHWDHNATLDSTSPRATHLIENNLHQLIRVIEQTNCITLPSFTQPKFRVTEENSQLSQIPNWIAAWNSNLILFKAGLINLKTEEELKKVENKLSHLILSGEKTESFSHIVASWASKAGEFPPDKKALWIKTITSCFNIKKMFDTPLSDLKELREYCLANIMPGSIHSYTLNKVINEGIKRHTDYLGGSPLALGYTLLPSISSEGREGTSASASIKVEAEIVSIIETAPEQEPEAKDYPDKLSLLKAKLAYRVAKGRMKQGLERIEGKKGETNE